tara:strand:- start:4146 stop:4598 length:453 start_codon:yes stop_codon:yes gene_type:complete
MKNIINQIFNRKLFKKVGGAVFYIDLLFASFLIAITIAGIGLFNAVKFGFQYSFFEFLFFIPFIVLVALFIEKWHNPKSNWEDLDDWSMLDYLNGLRTKTGIQKVHQKSLSKKFVNHFGVSMEYVKSKWYNVFQPWLILPIILILYFIFK